MRRDIQLKTHHLLVTKLPLDHTHHHQMPNQTVHRTTIPHVISRRSDMTVELIVYKVSQGNLVTRR